MVVTGLLMFSGAAQAVVANTALINGDSVTTDDGITEGGNPISLEQYAAEKAGFTVTVVTGSQWASMTQSDFAQYQLLIHGDPDCGTTADSFTSTAGTWAPVVMGTAINTTQGNRTLIGTDPEDHYQFGGGGAKPTDPSNPSTAGAEHLVQAGIAFAGAVPGATGVYFDTSCSDNGHIVDTLDKLTTTGPGNWNQNSSPPCGGSVQKIASVPQFSIVSDTDIQGWGCSDHKTWPGFPADWNPVAVATDAPTKPTCGTDPDTGTTACGESYVLVSGTGFVATSPDLSLSPATATNPVGTDHTVTATVAPNGTPQSGVVVSFAISGRNAGVSGTCTFSDGSADSNCSTGGDGKVNFTYHDVNGAGDDTINASITLNGTTEHATAAKTWKAVAPTNTTVTCTPNPVAVGAGTTCNAIVTDPPTGTVTWATNGSGNFGSSGKCTLSPGPAANQGNCSVAYTPSAVGTHKITANYGGDSNNGPSSGSTNLTVTAPKSQACVDRRVFRFTPHHGPRSKVTKVVVFIDGKLKRTITGHNIKRVTITKLPQTFHRVKIVVFLSNGSSRTSVRSYFQCTKGKPKIRSHHHRRHRHH